MLHRRRVGATPATFQMATDFGAVLGESRSSPEPGPPHTTVVSYSGDDYTRLVASSSPPSLNITRTEMNGK